MVTPTRHRSRARHGGYVAEWISDRRGVDLRLGAAKDPDGAPRSSAKEEVM
jgi:hypothetical protein